MCPELFNLGPLSIKTYGFFVALGFAAAIYYLSRQAAKQALSVETILDLGLYILLSGLIGARAIYVALNWGFYRSNLLEIFFIWSGGLVLYGGVVTAFIAVFFYLRKKKYDILKFADLFSPAFFLGLAIGRIGCLCAGCCYGRPTTGFWGIVFSNTKAFAPLNIKLVPTQILESLFSFIVFVFTHYLNRKKIFNSQTFFTAIIIYSLWRFFIEFFRGDDRGPMIFNRLYPSQFISILFLVISSVSLYYLWKKNLRQYPGQE
ncbi:MAG: prolipoprotein diacylglyceryl transferase [Elusimicrobia bacterium]|nr:prolipoprotein diacylglyceryl transferase [Elusimicrobiota bacterium]MBU2615316.1 prolipoprotein diacylglyceryl transferase [Elusimicrobiota bacterium]